MVLSSEAQEQFLALPTRMKARIASVFERLRDWPRVSGAKPLRAALAGQYRIRTGDYRVQFSVSGRSAAVLVTVLKIGHRDGFYDD